jgi:hypothetical protein
MDAGAWLGEDAGGVSTAGRPYASRTRSTRSKLSPGRSSPKNVRGDVCRLTLRWAGLRSSGHLCSRSLEQGDRLPRTSSAAPRSVRRQAGSLELVLRDVAADLRELAPPADDARVRELVPKSTDLASSACSGGDARDDSRKRTEKRLKERPSPSPNQQMQVGPGIPELVDADAVAASEATHGLADRDVRRPPTKRERAVCEARTEDEVERAARRDRAGDLSPSLRERAAVFGRGTNAELMVGKQRPLASIHGLNVGMKWRESMGAMLVFGSY